MDHKIVGIGIVGALAGMASLEATQPAAATPAPELKPAQSYADLLDPISNAVATLRAIDTAAGSQSAKDTASDGVQVAQYHHHHHHHHHRVVIRRHRHHHHHHHHHHY